MLEQKAYRLKGKAVKKQLFCDAAKKIAVKLIKAKQNNESKRPFGYASELFENVKISIPTINLNLENYCLAKQTASMAVSSSDNSTTTQSSFDSSATTTLVLTHTQAKNNNDAVASLAMDISDDLDSEEEFVIGFYHHTDDEFDSDDDYDTDSEGNGDDDDSKTEEKEAYEMIVYANIVKIN